MTRGSGTPASEPEKPHGQHQFVTLQEGFTIGSISPHPYHGNMDDNAAAEAEGLMDNGLSAAYVQASLEELTELCLSRSGGPPPTGDATDDDDSTHTLHAILRAYPERVARQCLPNSESHLIGVRKKKKR